MPKILENVREKILAEAESQVFTLGYSAMTIRSVAKACGIATGTVYNYFPSKEMLVASFMVDDWLKALKGIKDEAEMAESAEGMLRAVWDGVSAFTIEHAAVFADPEAVKGYSGAHGERHMMLVGQICDVMDPYIEKYAKERTPHFSEFIAEALLNWVMSGRDFAEFINITAKLFN